MTEHLHGQHVVPDEPYTPTGDEVRMHYQAHTHRTIGADVVTSGAEFDRFLANVRAEARRKIASDALREAAAMIRDACDRWEVDGDDERLVNEVLDPWVARIEAGL